jgi:hypothetical protein
MEKMRTTVKTESKKEKDLGSGCQRDLASRTFFGPQTFSRLAFLSEKIWKRTKWERKWNKGGTETEQRYCIIMVGNETGPGGETRPPHPLSLRTIRTNPVSTEGLSPGKCAWQVREIPEGNANLEKRWWICGNGTRKAVPLEKQILQRMEERNDGT